MVVVAQKLWYLLADGRMVKSPSGGYEGSSIILVALQMQLILYKVKVVGRETQVIFQLFFTMLCQVLRLETVQFSYYMVRQLVKTLSTVPL